MIIKDLQYIESVETSEIEGASFFFGFSSAFADADAEALSFGRFTSATTNTAVVADAGFFSSFSGSASSSTASASS